MKRKKSNQERSEARRQQVLDAAEDCFQKFGFHGASMADISRAASMSAGHIYNYFEGKEAIIKEIVERNCSEFLNFMTAVESESDITGAVVANIHEGVSEKLDGRHAGLMLDVMAEASRNPKMAEILRERDLVMREKLCNLVLCARTQNKAPQMDDIDGQVEVMIAMFEGLTLRGIANPALNKKSVLAAMERFVKGIFSGRS